MEKHNLVGGIGIYGTVLGGIMDLREKLESKDTEELFELWERFCNITYPKKWEMVYDLWNIANNNRNIEDEILSKL